MELDSCHVDVHDSTVTGVAGGRCLLAARRAGSSDLDLHHEFASAMQDGPTIPCGECFGDQEQMSALKEVQSLLHKFGADMDARSRV